MYCNIEKILTIAVFIYCIFESADRTQFMVRESHLILVSIKRNKSGSSSNLLLITCLYLLIQAAMAW